MSKQELHPIMAKENNDSIAIDGNRSPHKFNDMFSGANWAILMPKKCVEGMKLNKRYAKKGIFNYGTKGK